jgi:MOSC domain-containing protein YiiM
MPRVVHLQRVPYRHGLPVACGSLQLVEGLGIQDDCHRRPGSTRQVLLMAAENCDRFGLAPGEVRENVVTRGIDVQSLPPGTRLRLGGAVLEITKDCSPCPFLNSLRPRLLSRLRGRRGVLARVVATGTVRPGDPIATILPSRG